MTINRAIFALLICALAVSAGINIYLLSSSGSRPPNTMISESSVPKPRYVSSEPSRKIDDEPPLVSRRDVELLFESGDYLTALQALSYLPQGDALALRISWLSQCLGWIVEGDYPERVAAFIEAGFAIDPYDADFRQLRAEQLIAQGDVLQGLDLLYELLHQADPSLQGDYVSRVQQLFSEQVKQLEQQQAWQPLVTLVERLLWHEPAHPPYLLVHARALAKLRNYPAARASLQTILSDDYYGARAQELLQTIDRLAAGKERIALRAHGTHHLVDVHVNQRHDATLMIDTGASVTVFTQDYFDATIGGRATYQRDMVIATAGGKVGARLYRVDQFQVGAYTLEDFEIAVMPLDTLSNSDGLLGMNFLRRFEFEIDQQRRELILAPVN